MMNTFSLLIGIGASLGLLQIVRAAPPQAELRRGAGGLLVLAAALLGARINFALLHRSLFTGDLWAVLRFWEGGLAWPGALLGALAAAGALALIWRMPLGAIADILFPLFPALAVTAWLGCSQAGCAYGSEVYEKAPWAIRQVDETGLITYRWPLQLAAALSLVLIFWRLEPRADRGNPAGRQAALSAFVLGLHTFGFSWLRADAAVLAIPGLRLDLAASLLLAGLGLLGLLWLGLARLRANWSESSIEIDHKSQFYPHE